jgi:hypothetical protein
MRNNPPIDNHKEYRLKQADIFLFYSSTPAAK